MTRLDAYRALLARDEQPKPALIWLWKQADKAKVQIGRGQ